jgi:RNA polymerase sigma-70 factor (ECF subfamily)
MSASGSITRLVNGLGTPPGADAFLVPRLYEALLGIARVQKMQLPAGGLFTTSDVVHEAYVKMFAGRPSPWQNRAHFFGTAARAMQQVLIDHWRREGVRRRHRDLLAVPAESGSDGIDPGRIEELLGLLDRYALIEPTGAEMVRLRFFAGLGLTQVAEVLGVPRRTAQRRYLVALGWLSVRMND